MSARLTPPARLGAFALERELGRGGMGSVWLARRDESDALYALKLIPLASDEETLERFRREGEAMARVRAHPHLTQVHALVEDQGWLGLALEYCSGGDLEGRLRQGPLAPDAARELLSALSEGLEVAHAAGILHRDLKPANVIFDESKRPKLTDFGLAKLHDRQSLTQSGTLLGTPSYMAPEQATTGACDPRTDVYGLGGILYHCLSGGPPFGGASVLAVLDQVVSSPPPPLPASVPPSLAGACLRALAKAPEDRFPDAASFRAALREETPSPGPSRGLVLGAALFALFLSGGYLLHAALRGAPAPNQSLPATPAPSTPTPSPKPARVVPGLLPWPKALPTQPDRRVTFHLLERLAERDELAYPATLARHLRWRIRTPERLQNLVRIYPAILEPSLHIRAYEGGVPTLVGLAGHLRGNRPQDGFESDPITLELFLLGLLRNGDPQARGELLSHYRELKLATLREQLARADADSQAWRALGRRVEELLDARRTPGRLEEVMPRDQLRRFLGATWAELSPQSAYTFQLGLSLAPAGLESIKELELRAAAMGLPEGGDAGLLVSATCAGDSTSARGLARHLLQRPREAEQAVGRALCAVAFLAADRNVRRTMAEGGELARAGILAPGEVPSGRSLEENLAAALRAAGLLGPPPPSRLRALPVLPPKQDDDLDVRAILEELLPEAPILQCLWREVLWGGRSPQAIELREALGAKGLSALKHLTKSLGDPGAHYYDPVLATRLALRLMPGGRRGTAMILFMNIERSQSRDLNELLSACLGLSSKFDDDAQAHSVVVSTTKHELRVPELAPSWERLRLLDAELAQRPFRAASQRVGPPPRISVERLVQATSSTFVRLRWLQRMSHDHYHSEASTERLYEVAMEPVRLRPLLAAFRRGEPRALLPLLDTKRVRDNHLLRMALIQFLISSEEGAPAARESWRLAYQGLRHIKQGKLAGVLEGLRRDPTRADLWRSFYLARERTWLQLGIPSQPELGAWGTPRELLSERAE